jgi:TRAP transporter TAXI family solute receptor
MRKKGTKITVISLILFIFSLASQGVILPSRTAHAEVKQLSMGTATVGGIFYNIGAPVATCINQALPEANITAEITQGSTENLRLIKAKKMQLAVITPMIGYFARKGIRMFKDKPVDFRVVVRLLPNGNVWGVLEKSDVHQIAELKGKKVGVGPASGGLGVVARTQLTANGINFKKDLKPYFLGAGAMAEALKDGTIEGTILTAELAKLVATTHPLRLLPWEEEAIVKFLKEYPYFGRYVHPPGTFKGIDYPVLTVDNGIQLICDTDLDDDLVYKLAKAAIENIDCMIKIYSPANTLTPAWMASELANPFHPGAIKYFKEKGL